MHAGLWWGVGGSLSDRNHLEEQGVDGRIILLSIFKNWDRGHGLD
jgi:hypothetical protein